MSEEEDDVQTRSMIAALQKENAEMEEEIARLSAKPATPQAKPQSAITDVSGVPGIKVMIFKETQYNPSHEDNGAIFTPPQCGGRNDLGGFYCSK